MGKEGSNSRLLETWNGPKMPVLIRVCKEQLFNLQPDLKLFLGFQGSCRSHLSPQPTHGRQQKAGGTLPCTVKQIYPQNPWNFEGKKTKSSVKPYTEDVTLPLWQPAWGCRTAVADAVWCPAVKPEESLQVGSDQTFDTLATEPLPRSHTAGHSWCFATFFFLSRCKLKASFCSCSSTAHEIGGRAVGSLAARINPSSQTLRFYSSDPSVRSVLQSTPQLQHLGIILA